MSADDQLDMDAVRSIEASVSQLASAILVVSGTQSNQIEKLQSTTDRLRRTIKWTVIGLTLDLVLTLGGVYLFERSAENSQRIQANQEALRTRQSTTKPALCSLYDLFLDSWNPQSPSAKADPVSYADSFARLEDGARTFGCAHHTRGRD